jgi:hypothetical protein
MLQAQTSAWKPPRLRPEILLATAAQATEYMAWFVNRRAYTRQTDRPDEKSGKYFFYQARDRQTKERLALYEQVVRGPGLQAGMQLFRTRPVLLQLC